MDGVRASRTFERSRPYQGGRALSAGLRLELQLIIEAGRLAWVSLAHSQRGWRSRRSSYWCICNGVVWPRVWPYARWGI